MQSGHCPGVADATQPAASCPVSVRQTTRSCSERFFPDNICTRNAHQNAEQRRDCAAAVWLGFPVAFRRGGGGNSTTTSSWVSAVCVVEAASDNITRTTYIMPRLVCREGANDNPKGTKHEPFPIACARGIARAETNADHDLFPVRYLGNHKLRPLHQRTKEVRAERFELPTF